MYVYSIMCMCVYYRVRVVCVLTHGIPMPATLQSHLHMEDVLYVSTLISVIVLTVMHTKLDDFALMFPGYFCRK